MSVSRSTSTSTSARTSGGSAGTAPTLPDLLAFARASAADAELVASLPLHAGQRTWLRLAGPGGSEAWLIGWPPGSETGWHDHGGSSGAFATASGALVEHSLAVELPTGGWRTLELLDGQDRVRRLPAGRGRAFGPRHIHQVVNASDTEHAVSVHVYHPSLPLMHRYSRKANVLRLEAVERPEDW